MNAKINGSLRIIHFYNICINIEYIYIIYVQINNSIDLDIYTISPIFTSCIPISIHSGSKNVPAVTPTTKRQTTSSAAPPVPPRSWPQWWQTREGILGGAQKIDVGWFTKPYNTMFNTMFVGLQGHISDISINHI